MLFWQGITCTKEAVCMTGLRWVEMKFPYSIHLFSWKKVHYWLLLDLGQVKACLCPACLIRGPNIWARFSPCTWLLAVRGPIICMYVGLVGPSIGPLRKDSPILNPSPFSNLAKLLGPNPAYSNKKKGFYTNLSQGWMPSYLHLIWGFLLKQMLVDTFDCFIWVLRNWKLLQIQF